MFDAQHLSDILELHEQSFAFLKWIRSALKQGLVSFSVVHHTTDTATAAAEWIERYFENIPEKIRPQRDRISTFSRLFVSFLTTSYKLNPNGLRLISQCGCRCSYCAYLQAGPNLDPRTPTKKDDRISLELKSIYLTTIVEESGILKPSPLVDQLRQDKKIADEISMATWGFELLRRSEYASQGTAVLALWRQFAWRNHSPIPGFKISSERIVQAEKVVLQTLEEV